MAFEGLTDKLQNAFQKLKGKGKLTEADVKEVMREVRLALLEADVNFLVVMGAPPRLIGINSVNLNHFKLPISLFLYWFNQFNAPLSSFPAAVDRFNRQVVALS